MLTHLCEMGSRKILALNHMNIERLEFTQASLICKLTNKGEEKKALVDVYLRRIWALSIEFQWDFSFSQT